MKAATLFSGIGAPEVAMPDWRWIWHAEIEKFPSAVMRERHPSSVNLGDVTAHDFIERAIAIGRPDVLVFGSPCQSYSVAGKRLGLDDPRGNLALVALGIINRLRPAWFVFENVPGLLSSWSGLETTPHECVTEWDGDETSDFAAFLGAVQDIGYSSAWTMLDAQFAGLAQRRDRLFAVGCPGAEWRRAAAVLLEPESLCGHPPSREQARQDVTGAIGAGSTRCGSRVGHREAAAGQIVAHPLLGKGNSSHDDSKETYVPDVSPAMKARDAKGASSDGDGDGLPLVMTHSLRADGFDASEDGTGRGTPLVVSHSLDAASAGRATEDGTWRGCPIVPVLAQPLTTGGDGARGYNDPTNATLVAVFDPNQVTSKANRSQPHLGLSHPLPAQGNAPVAYAIGSHAGAADGDQTNRSHASGGPVGLNVSEEQAYALRGGRTQAVAYAFVNTAGETNRGFATEQAPPITTRHGDPGNVLSVALRGRAGGGTAELGGEVATALRASQGGGDKPHALTSGVRRLMPIECERLQGFPDNYTTITYRGKPAADGPRYKAIGNSMAVPVVRWILTRLALVHALPKDSEAVA